MLEDGLRTAVAVFLVRVPRQARDYILQYLVTADAYLLQWRTAPCKVPMHAPLSRDVARPVGGGRFPWWHAAL